jgi:hypothetical protein
MTRLHANRLTAEVTCVCGLTIRVERDEDGAGAPTLQCAQPGCEVRICDHEHFECCCGAKTCGEHAVILSGRVTCHVCAAGELADLEAELAEVA